MAQHKEPVVKVTPKTITVLIILVLFLALAAYVVASVKEQYHTNTIQFTIQLNENRYTIDRLAFCVDNKLAPCTGETINSWNQANPDNTFTLLSKEKIIEDSIEDAKALK